MSLIDEEYWDNFAFITLHVVDWELRRILHKLDVPIDEAEGWPQNMAFEKIGEMMEALERLLEEYEDDLDSGEMKFDDIQI